MHSQKRILTAAVAAALFAIGASAAQADEYTTLDTIKPKISDLRAVDRSREPLKSLRH